jgi:Flp pilus assembly protein TadG
MSPLAFLRRDDGAAALEAATLMPLFLTLAVGAVDLGTAMFEAMQMNAAAQAGMASGVIDPTLAGVKAAMTSAAGGFTLDTTLSTSSIVNGVVTVTAACDTGKSGSCAPILPWPMKGSFIKSAFPAHLAATITVRVF